MDNNTLEFRYIFKEDYNPVYVNGAYGGIGSMGEIIINFYLERMPVPYNITNVLNEDGSIGDNTNTNPDNLHNKIIRFVSQGIVINKDTAEHLYKWLGTQIEKCGEYNEHSSNE